MDTTWRTIIWSQFGAAIDMLENALGACPDLLWRDSQVEHDPLVAQRFPWGEVSFAELLLDNMRHVQEHAAQLNLVLGQKTGSAPGWVARAR